MEEIFTNMGDCIHSNLHTYLIKYITNSQMHTTNNATQVINELMKQEMKPDSAQCYNLHKESIILDLFAEKDIYNNYSYESFADL